MQLICDGVVLSLDENNRIVADGAVAFDGDTIIEVGERSRLLEAYPNAGVIDAHGGVIMPGLVDLSVRSGNMLFSSFDAFSPGARLAFSKKLTLNRVRLSAFADAIECIKNGITTVFDRVFAPNDIAGSLQMAASAYSECGVRACLCFETTPQLGSARMKAMADENREFIDYCRCRDSGLAAMFGLADADDLSVSALSAFKSAAPSSGFCISVEKRGEHAFAGSAIERLKEAGLLGPKTLLCDLPAPSEEDAETLANTGTAVIPAAEPPFRADAAVSKAIDKPFGFCRVLGTGYSRPDMFEAARHFSVLLSANTAETKRETISRMLFRSNPGFASRIFNKTLGKLAPGAPADIIVLDSKPFGELTEGAVIDHLLSNASGRDCTHTIVRGRVLMRSRRLEDIDEDRLYKELTAMAKQLYGKKE